MPSPKDARKDASKRTPDRNDADLGHELARRKSQDFKSKIDGWIGAGAGVALEQDNIEVPAGKPKASAKKNPATPDRGTPNKVAEPAAKALPITPPTPQTPVAGDSAGAKEGSAKKPSREIDPGRKAWIRRRSKSQTHISPDAKPDEPANSKVRVSPNVEARPTQSGTPEDSPNVKRTLTPRRRLVSDEHWRVDRTPKTDDATPEKEASRETTPKPRIVKRSVASVGLKVPPSVQDFKEDIEPRPIRVRPLRRPQRSRSTSREREDGKPATPDFESGGTKVYIKRRRKSQAAERDRKAFNTSESSLTAPSSVERPSSATDVTAPDVTPTKTYKFRSSTEPRLPTRARLSNDKSAKEEDDVDYNDLPRRVRQRRPKTPLQEEDDRLRLSKRANSTTTTESFKIPANNATKPAPKVYGSRIEGWLAGMPDDPFTEPLMDPSLVPQGLNVSRKSSRAVDTAEREETTGLHRSTVRRKRSKTTAADGEPNDLRKPSSGESRSSDDLGDRSPGSLKRNGALRNTRSASYDLGNRSAPQQTDDASIMDRPRPRPSKRRVYGDLPERPFPSTGNRLSTIASVSTLREQRFSNPDESVLSRASDGDEPTRHSTVLRRRSMKHSDLMSVLSLPEDDQPPVKPSRTRSRRPRPDSLTADDLMNEVTSEELKYQRELRTLVDGVIPVLLQYVLSQSSSPKGSTSRSGFKKGDPTLTQPIINMGVVLERLKSHHRRIPMHNPEELLRWAQNASKIYSDYMGVWRLGFNDIVVNLAPAEQTSKNAWDDGLPRNENGDLLDGDGERVDVAYLLKRPLVRIKSFSKTFRGISQIRPSPLAQDMTNIYEDLVTRAKQRANDEHARLEDEAASGIDPSRARDPRNLAPLAGVAIDRSRCVRARDFFDLEFFHSSGQQLDCKIEVIFRDDQPGRGGAGDILFCEISPAGRWLLFPPVFFNHASARKGDKDGEMIVMIRGQTSSGDQWSEMMSLQSSDPQSQEWIDMLGSDPMPPRLTRRSSFNTLSSPRVHFATRSPSVGSDLPIGEQARPTGPRWDSSTGYTDSSASSRSQTTTTRPEPSRDYPSSPLDRDGNAPAHLRFAPPPSGFVQTAAPADDQNDAYTRHVHARSKSEWLPSDGPGSRNPENDGAYGEEDDESGTFRKPTLRKRTSSVPSMQLPTIGKLRRAIGLDAPNKEPEQQRDEPTPVAMKEPTSAPAKLQKQPVEPKPEVRDHYGHHTDNKTPTRATGMSSIPTFTPAFLQKPRRSSSPLKHEYEPSTATESSESELSDEDDNESLTSESSADEAVSTLGELQNFNKYVSMRTHVQPPHIQHTPVQPPHVQVRPPDSLYSGDADTLGPSESASQAPYRTVPTTNGDPAKSVACIFAWSENGSWESIHGGDCQIVVTPGLIEAFDIARVNGAASQSGSSHESGAPGGRVRPLIALELTPWVPLRRGTAVDISIRSPPTSASILQKGNNIMFRSRSPEECERLYNMINRARIDNPTWIALQNARGPPQTSNWGEVMERRNNERSETNSSAWFKAFSRKGSTYRSKGTRSGSVAGTQSSIGTVNSAFSAIRQFGGTSKIFNIGKSTIMSKQSTRSSYSDSLSSGAATPLPIDPSLGTPVGITNAKIRLYVRESMTKWRDMGNARLTITLPPRRDVSGPADPRITGLEKRVLVCGKKGNSVLDVTLGESCFERVARTGIAVSVWEESVGSNGEVGHAAATGGVSSSKSTVYMIQMKSERDAAYTFSMVGKLRY